MSYSNSSYHGSSHTVNYRQSQSMTRGNHRSYDSAKVPSVASRFEPSRSRRRHSAPAASKYPPTTIYIVKNYSLGDKDPSFAWDPDFPPSYQNLSTALGSVYRELTSQRGQDDPYLVRCEVKLHLAEINMSLRAHREKCVERGALPPDAEVLEMRLAPTYDSETSSVIRSNRFMRY